MRISLLEKREDFYEILKRTLNKSSFFKDQNEKEFKTRFIVNKYLNFIATKKISRDVFQNLVNEYSNSIVWWNKITQKTYVYLAVSKLFRNLFGNKIIELSVIYSEYLILGGNHRLRLFSKDLGFSVLLLKENERCNYIDNDITIRTNQFLSYAPIIYENGKEWLKEEYFAGKPLNRLKDGKQIDFFQKKVIKSHLEELLLLTMKSWTNREYQLFINSEIDIIVSNKYLQKTAISKNTISTIFDLLFKELSIDNIPVSWSHGDFQMANVLVKENNFKVIDWESANKRYYLYDIYTLIGNVRSSIPLKESIEVFRCKIPYFLDVVVTHDMIILLFIEELRFSVNEEYSENFYVSGLKTKKICNSIKEYLNE
jgi:predicted Ser/Thr protein kinase